MAFYQLRSEQLLNASLDEVWDFISSPENLEKITPKSMNFKVSSDIPDKMYEGLIIKYKVSPIKGYRTTWVSEITQIRDREFFIDEQRVGPYALWHHQHHIQEVPGGVMMRDIVSYSPPFGILGKLANALFIRHRLKQIFSYREEQLNKIFTRQ